MRPVNLLPQDQRRRAPREGTGTMAYPTIGVLAVLLAMVVAYVLTSNQVSERQTDAQAASAEADRLEAEAAAKGGFSEFAQVAQTRMSSVAGVAAGRFDWERFMRELSRVMPEGSWLQASDASVAGGDTEVTSTDAAAAGASGPTANLVGCTPDQSDVARMMVRLGQMHRVDDVRLNESVQETAGQAPSFESCGSAYKFDLTVVFSAAAPASEAPRGTDRVPAALGGGS